MTDAWSPPEIAARVRDLGVTKARRGVVSTFVLAVLAGAFIALGGLFFLVATTGSDLGFGPTRVLGGLSFSLGLLLVVVGGAELFTGNNLLAMAWASRLLSTRDVLRNWAIVYAGNALGAGLTAGMAWLGGIHRLGQGAVGETLSAVVTRKAGLDPLEAVVLGLLCNGLVCLAVWLTMGGRTVADKAVAVVFPVAAFVALGLEHSIANLFFLPFGWLTGAPITLAGILANLAWVTLGNVLGGTVLVAAVYWLAYLREG